MAVCWNDGEQCLSRRDDSPNGVDRKLLNRTFPRRRQIWRAVFLLSLGSVLRKAVSLAFGLGKLAEKGTMNFGDRLCPRFSNCGQARLRLVQLAALDDQFLLLL